jgi:hypothetical protein
MDDIQKIIDILGIGEYINTILVEKGGRKAFMIQPPDYNERTAKDNITKQKLEIIHKYFPNLHQTITDWGIIITKYKLNPNSIKDDSDIGKILGYPCYKEYNKVRTSINNTFAFDIIVNLKSSANLKNYKNKIILFTDRCLDKSTYIEHETIKNKIENILKKDEVIGNLLESVELGFDTVINVNVLLSKIKSNKKLNKEEMDELLNLLYNLGFSIELQFAVSDLDMDNPFNRGIISTLLTYYMNNPLEAFFPLQQFPEHHTILFKKEQEWEKSLIQLLIPKKKKILNKTMRRKHK